MVPFLTSSLLQNISCIQHGFMTHQGGVSSYPFASLNINFGKGDQDESVTENRRRIALTFGEPLENLCTVVQVHGTKTVVVENAFQIDKRPEADAMVTNTPGVILGVSTADCVPVLLVDPIERVIGAAHAGWRGATQGILQSTLQAMEDLGAKREHITAALGPCIWQSSYEVDQEFYENLLQDSAFFIPSSRSNHWLFDLPGYVEKTLRTIGLSQIDSSPKNTFTNPKLFCSFRRWTLFKEPPMGGQLSIIKLQRP